MKIQGIISIMTLSALAGSAMAGTITGTLTADNHYALFTNVGGVMSLVGGNELDAGGNPGAYNWSQAESWSFTPGTALFIATWSDKSVAQGLLADFDLGDGFSIRSGSEGWDVVGTGIDMNDGSPLPDADLIQQQVNNANSNHLWHLPYVGERNLPSTQPWGKIDGISEDAYWMWNPKDGMNNPLTSGGNADEMLIFRTFVPTPGTLACAGFGGLMLTRRRR